MSQAVYSTRIFSGLLSTAANWVTLAQVPSGHRLVITFVSFTQGYASGALTVLALASNGAELFRAAPSQVSSSAAQECRIVLHEGESVLGRAYTNQSTLHCSGFLLVGAGGPLVPGTLPSLPNF